MPTTLTDTYTDYPLKAHCDETTPYSPVFEQVEDDPNFALETVIQHHLQAADSRGGTQEFDEHHDNIFDRAGLLSPSAGAGVIGGEVTVEHEGSVDSDDTVRFEYDRVDKDAIDDETYMNTGATFKIPIDETLTDFRINDLLAHNADSPMELNPNTPCAVLLDEADWVPESPCKPELSSDFKKSV